jgi:ABC-type uncharacterized transport system auxiliary subunit
MQRGRRVGGATVVAALVGLFALAGCSNSPGVTKGGAESTSSTSAAPTTSILPSSTSVPLSTIPTAASAVLDAYRAGVTPSGSDSEHEGEPRWPSRLHCHERARARGRAPRFG